MAKIEINTGDEDSPRDENGAADDVADQTAAADDAAGSADDAMETLKRDLVELDDKYKRALADYQNYARRARLEAEHARKQQLQDVARKLLTVLDHFDHALQVDPQKVAAQSVIDGVKIVHDELVKTLAHFGIERMTVQVGEPFDPNRHEALMRQAVEDLESNHVSQELQPGYMLGEQTLRPAKVAVSE